MTQRAVPALKFESAVQVLPHVSGYKGPPAFTLHTEEITGVGVRVNVAVKVGVDAAASQAQARKTVNAAAQALLLMNFRNLPGIFKSHPASCQNACIVKYFYGVIIHQPHSKFHFFQLFTRLKYKTLKKYSRVRMMQAGVFVISTAHPLSGLSCQYC